MMMEITTLLWMLKMLTVSQITRLTAREQPVQRRWWNFTAGLMVIRDIITYRYPDHYEKFSYVISFSIFSFHLNAIKFWPWLSIFLYGSLIQPWFTYIPQNYCGLVFIYLQKSIISDFFSLYIALKRFLHFSVIKIYLCFCFVPISFLSFFYNIKC